MTEDGEIWWEEGASVLQTSQLVLRKQINKVHPILMVKNMTKKMLSDMVFRNIQPPDYKKNLNTKDLSEVLVRRMGLKRKNSRANHARLLEELIKLKKDSVPVDIAEISHILEVSQSQAYEELRKWRTLGLIEFVRIPAGRDMVKGYMLSSNTVNRMLDRVESSFGAFMRGTRRIAKDFDDALAMEIVRPSERQRQEELEEHSEEE